MKNFAILPMFNGISNNDEILINLDNVLFIEKTVFSDSRCRIQEKYFIHFSNENKIEISLPVILL